MRIQDAVNEGVADYASRAEELFGMMYSDTSAFEERLRKGLVFSGADPHAENKVGLVKHGFFSLELFQAMICGGAAFKARPINVLWDRLVEAGVVMKAFPAVRGTPLADHQIIHPLLLQHLRDNTFANLFARPSALCDRYQHAIVMVDVLKGGDVNRGTGFVVQHKGRMLFLTCRHNVDPAQDVELQELTTAAGATLNVGDFALADQHDIAVASVQAELGGPCFAFSNDAEVFDQVFTLGYPRIPRAESILLGHRGEVNGRAHLYAENCPALIISNLVSPGSSGGPVLDRWGRCVGMTINWLEGKLLKQPAAEHDDEQEEKSVNERLRFSAALPADLLSEVIDRC